MAMSMINAVPILVALRSLLGFGFLGGFVVQILTVGFFVEINSKGIAIMNCFIEANLNLIP